MHTLDDYDELSTLTAEVGALVYAGFDSVYRADGHYVETVSFPDVLSAYEETSPDPSEPYPVERRSYTFTRLINGTPYGEGPEPLLADTPEEALRMFRDGWLTFRERHPGNVLFVRKPLELRCHEDYATGNPARWSVQMRIAIASSLEPSGPA